MSAARSLTEHQPHVRQPRQIEAMLNSFPRFRNAYEAGPEIPWEREVIAKLDEVLSLPAGWDTYDAPPVDWGAAMFGLVALRSAMDTRTPVPQVVPTPEGAVQFEWHQEDLDIEFVVTAPYEADLWFHDDRGVHEPVSTPISQDFAVLRKAVAKLATR